MTLMYGERKGHKGRKKKEGGAQTAEIKDKQVDGCFDVVRVANGMV